MSGPPPSSLGTAVVVLGVLGFVIVRRAAQMVSGARYSPARLFAFMALYLLLFAGLAFSTIYGAVDAWGDPALTLLLPYGGAVAGGALLAEPYVRRTVRFEERAPGQWYYRLPAVLPALYLGLFAVRFGAELLLFGASSFTSPFLPTGVPTSLLFVLIAIDLLFGTSVGLLFGRTVGVYRAFLESPRRPTVASSPGGR